MRYGDGAVNFSLIKHLILAKMCLMATVIPVAALAAENVAAATEAADFVVLRGLAALPDEPNGTVLTIQSISTVAAQTHITLAAAAEEWIIEIPADFVITRQFAAGDEITLLSLRNEQGGTVLGYALIAGGEFVFYVADKKLPLYGRQIDG